MKENDSYHDSLYLPIWPVQKIDQPRRKPVDFHKLHHTVIPNAGTVSNVILLQYQIDISLASVCSH